MKGFAYSGGTHRELSALGLTRDVQLLVLVGFVFFFRFILLLVVIGIISRCSSCFHAADSDEQQNNRRVDINDTLCCWM